MSTTLQTLEDRWELPDTEIWRVAGVPPEVTPWVVDETRAKLVFLLRWRVRISLRWKYKQWTFHSFV